MSLNPIRAVVAGTLQDLRFALRMLGREPGFAAAAIMVLGLGIGVNASVFSLVNAVFLRPLDVTEPERLTAIYHVSTKDQYFSSTSHPDYTHYRDNARSFSGLAAYCRFPVVVGSGETAESISGEVVTPNYFGVLGIRAAAGRLLAAEDERQHVAVISHRLWRERFAGAPDAIGRTVRIGTADFRIIGVAPRSFRGIVMDWGKAPEWWVPIAFTEEVVPLLRPFHPLEARGMRWLLVAGRLNPGVTLQQARAELRVLDAQLDTPRPTDRGGFDALLFPMHEARFWPGDRPETARYLAILSGIAAIVLLVACANCATLLLMRGARRAREIAVRLALGAGRRRLARQFITEGLLLSALAGAAGVSLAVWTTDVLLATYTVLPQNVDARLDWRVLVFAAAITLATALIVGLAPLRTACRVTLLAGLQERHGRRLAASDFSVALQVALSMVLLVGAALLTRTLHNAQRADITPEPDRLLLVDFSLPGSYTPERAAVFQEQLLGRLRALPGVQSASLAMVVPLGGRRGEQNVNTADARAVQVDFNSVSPGYFGTLGIPIVAGHDLDARDSDALPAPALINEAFARRFWPGEDPLGKTFEASSSGPLRVIGVVRDALMRNYRDTPRPCFYVSVFGSPGPLTLEARTLGRALDLLPAVRHEFAELDPHIAPVNPRTMRMHVAAGLSRERMASTLVSGLGVLTLALASFGLYAVVGAAVTRRVREIGIRIAIGAPAGGVVSMLVRRALLLAGAGIAVGVALALPLTRYIRTMLFGVGPGDILSFAAAALLLLVVAGLAAWIPARRAARADPILALRCE
ncbi:MAG: ABC transporter permease [bacterium]|jgi:predicted permease